MISDDIIKEIKERLDLAEYVGRTLNLKRVGRVYQALCPFHVEKTPSFTVYPDSKSWYCFGSCDEGGDIYSYVQKREGLTFPETLRLLACECGIHIEGKTAIDHDKERLQSLCEAAAQQFQQWLYKDPHAQPCRDYIKQRHLSAEFVHRFGLGYAPDSWNRLLNVLLSRGYDPKDMVKVGLAREREQGGYYDGLRNRLVFPIRDFRGRIVGFAGRALTDGQLPKYINSPANPLFDKSHLLYGLDLAKDAIRKSQEGAIVVEGYIDCITAHQAGFTNVVATMGTALTNEQFQLVTRYSPNLILALDADAAGERATKRNLLNILGHHRPKGRPVPNIRVLLLPDGYDPDDLITGRIPPNAKSKPQEWTELVANALPVIDYLIRQSLQGANLDNPIEKERIAKELLPIIAGLNSAVMRDHYITRLAHLLRTDERVLAQELHRYSANKPHRDDTPPPPTNSRSGKPVDLETYLLYLLLFPTWHPSLNLPPQLPQDISAHMWQQPHNRQLWEAIAKNKPTNLEEFIDQLDPYLARRLRHIFHFYATSPTSERLELEWESELQLTLTRFYLEHKTWQARQITYLLGELEGEVGDLFWMAEVKLLLRRRMAIEYERTRLQNELWELRRGRI